MGTEKCSRSWLEMKAIKRSIRNKITLAAVLLALLLSGCLNNMRDQPRYEPLEVSQFFSDQRSARPLVDNTVPRGALIEERVFATGRTEDGDLVEDIPAEITADLLERGQERYDIFCSPCHGFDGFGEGMIVQRGFTPPPSFHSNRLRQSPAGHYFDVITNGFGQMFSYGYRIQPDDRWAIVAYIRALQISQNASHEDVPRDELQQLEQQGN